MSNTRIPIADFEAGGVSRVYLCLEETPGGVDIYRADQDAPLRRGLPDLQDAADAIPDLNLPDLHWEELGLTALRLDLDGGPPAIAAALYDGRVELVAGQPGAPGEAWVLHLHDDEDGAQPHAAVWEHLARWLRAALPGYQISRRRTAADRRRYPDGRECLVGSAPGVAR